MVGEITCLCPTYGRYALLRRSLGCFLRQDHPNKHLLIWNDAPVPIVLDEGLTDTVTVVNSEPFKRLGAKRQAMLEAVETPYAAHWDDDDEYLPWHLTTGLQMLGGGAWCSVRQGCWQMSTDVPIYSLVDKAKGAAYVFRVVAAIRGGGYAAKSPDREIWHWEKRRPGGMLWCEHKFGCPSFIWQPAGSWGHTSRRNGDWRQHHYLNTDFGDQQPLTPDRPRWAWHERPAASGEPNG